MRIRSPLVFLVAAIALVVGLTWWHARKAPLPKVAEAAVPAGVLPDATPATHRPVATPPPDALRLPRAERNRERHARQRAAVARINAAGREKIVGRYESENIDPAWSNATRQALMAPSLAASDQIRATHSEPSGLAVDCRSTTCRVTADFPNRIAADDWSTFYLTGAGDRLPNATLRKTTNTDGSVRVEIYAIARR